MTVSQGSILGPAAFSAYTVSLSMLTRCRGFHGFPPKADLTSADLQPWPLACIPDPTSHLRWPCTVSWTRLLPAPKPASLPVLLAQERSHRLSSCPETWTSLLTVLSFHNQLITKDHRLFLFNKCSSVLPTLYPYSFSLSWSPCLQSLLLPISS